MIFRFPNAMIHGRVMLLLMVSLALAACGKTEVSDTEHVSQAKQYQSSGDFKASFIELKNALQKNPNNSEARLLLGELYLKIGDGDAAEKEIGIVINLGVNDSYIQSLMARAMLLQNRFQNALNYIDGIKHNDEPALLTLSADAYYGLGQIDKARSIYINVIEKHENYLEALLGLAKLHLNAGNATEAKVLAERALKRNPQNADAIYTQANVENRLLETEKAMALYQQVVELEPDNIITQVSMNARTSLSRLLLAQKKYDEASQNIEFLLDLSPNHPIPNYLAALLAYENKNYSQARDYAQKVVEIRPKYIPNLIVLGSSNYALGNIEQAEAQLTEVLTNRPALFVVRAMLANIKIRQEESSAALDLLRPIIEQSADDVSLLTLAGQVALSSGDLEEGKAWINKAIKKSPEEKNLRTQLAMLYMAEGNNNRAIKELESVISQGGSPHREKTLLAMSHIRQKDYEKALLVVGELLEEYPTSAFAHNLMGIIYNEMGDVGKARAEYLAALDISREFIPALLNISRLEVMTGNLKEAEEKLDRVLSVNKNNVSAMIMFAQLAEASNDKAQALEWLEKARVADPKGFEPRLILARHYLRKKNMDMVSTLLREAIEHNPDEPGVLRDLGIFQASSGRNAAAIVTFKKLVEREPTALNYYWLSASLFREGDLATARANLSRSLGLDPAFLRSSSLMVLLDVNEGKKSNALKQIENIKRSHPESPAGFELEGDVLSSFGSPDMAIQAYRQAQLKGGGGGVLLKEAAVLRKTQGNAAANMAISKWLEVHPDDMLVRYALAGAYKKMGNPDLAIKEYRYLLTMNADNPVVLNELAWSLHESGESLEAEKLANKAHLLEPENGAILDTLGWVMLGRGEDVKKALGFLRQANEKIPNNPEIQFHLATALVESGDTDKAKAILKRILEENTSFPDREDAAGLLATL